MNFIVDILSVSCTFVGIIVFFTFVFFAVRRCTRLTKLECQVNRLETLLREMEQDTKIKNDFVRRLQRIYSDLDSMIP